MTTSTARPSSSRRRPQRPEARRQGDRQGQGGGLRRRRRRACLPRPLVALGLQARERLRLRHQGRGLQGPHGGDGPGEVALRPGHQGAHAGRHRTRRRPFPRPVGRRRVEARDDHAMARRSADPRARQPGARNQARGRPGGPPGCHPLHGPLRLSQPGQQRAVLSLSFFAARSMSARPASTRR